MRTKKRVVADTTKVRIFKQITTLPIIGKLFEALLLIPQRYEFSSKSQLTITLLYNVVVVADTTKVRIFKQITTKTRECLNSYVLLLIPQRYEFSSKSQPTQFLRISSLLLLIPQRDEFSSKSQLSDLPSLNKSGCC